MMVPFGLSEKNTSMLEKQRKKTSAFFFPFFSFENSSQSFPNQPIQEREEYRS